MPPNNRAVLVRIHRNPKTSAEKAAEAAAQAAAQAAQGVSKAAVSANSADTCIDAENNLLRAALYASHPKAQHFVALNADFMMDRRNHGWITPFSNNPSKSHVFESNNHCWKPKLVPALENLVEAGTLTPKNLTPELSAVISTFRNRYPKEEIPASVQPIFDAVPQTLLKTKLMNLFRDPKKVRDPKKDTRSL